MKVQLGKCPGKYFDVWDLGGGGGSPSFTLDTHPTTGFASVWRGSAKGLYEESKRKATGRIVGAQAPKLEKPGPALGVALSQSEK